MEKTMYCTTCQKTVDLSDVLHKDGLGYCCTCYFYMQHGHFDLVK